MADLKNPAKADLNKDGKLSSYEKKRGAAIEKAMDKSEGMSRAQQAAIAIAKMKKEELAELVREVLAETEVEEAVTQMHVTAGNKADIKAALKKKGVTDTSSVDKAKPGEVIAVEELTSVGHVDNEPGMLKQFAYDTADYAAKLYKLLHHYEQMEDHVDFPNWWQHKVMMAREYMSKATHYLEFETMKPHLDAKIDGHSEEEHMHDRELNELFGRVKNKTVNYKGHDYKILDIDSAGTFTLIDPQDPSAEAFHVNRAQMKAGRVPDVKAPEVEDVPLVNLKEEDDIEAPTAGFEDDSAKAPKGDKKLNKAASKNDKIISTYKKIKPFFKKAAAGDKEALAIVKANQDVIKAYKKLTQTHLAENKATCCGKCGRTHVKGTECKKPFLTGKDHCRVR